MIKTLKALENLKPGKIKSIGRKGDKFKVNFEKTWAMIDRFANGKGKACFKKLNDENVPNELGKFYKNNVWTIHPRFRPRKCLIMDIRP